MSELIASDDYRKWIASIKQRVQASQIKAAVSVNREMLDLYWFIGEQILDKQQTAKWGDGFLKQMSQDLLTEFPAMKGFSRRNLELIRQWFLFWSTSDALGKQTDSQIAKQPDSQLAQDAAHWPQPVAKTGAIGQQLVSQIPWGHNILIVQRLRDLNKPIGVSEYQITQNLPEQLRNSLPSIEQFEAELGGFSREE